MKWSIPTPEAGEVAKHIGDGRDAGVAETGPVASVRDRVDPLNRIHSDVGVRVDHYDGQADAIRDVEQIVPRAAGRFRDPADVEGVKRSAGLAGRIVFRHGDNVDDAVTATLGGAANRAI